MKIIVYGYNGWIGKQFIDYLKSSNSDICIINGLARLDDVENFSNEIDIHVPDSVVCFTGRTHGTINGVKYPTIDYLEQSGKLKDNVRDNLFAPVSAAIACRDKGIHLAYLGTGCIFTYEGLTEDYSFTEDDKPNFTGSSYSTVKGFTDRLMHQLHDTVLNMRIRMPIVGYDCERNFITKIKTYEKVCSMKNSMTVLEDFFPVIVDMLKNKETGTINLTNPGDITHNEILQMYKDIVDPTFIWKNFTVDEQNKILASGRSNTILSSTKMSMKGVPNIKESIKKLFNNYKLDNSFNKSITVSDFEDIKSTVIFITGGAGFIGSSFINHLYSTTKNLRIINFDALYYCANVENINPEVIQSNRYTFINGNLQSYDLLKYIINDNKITHIINFAAQSHVDNSFTNSKVACWIVLPSV